MKMIKRYAGILMMLTLLVGFTSCESEEETEFGSSSNLVVISFLFQLSSSFLILLKVVDMFAF